MTDTEVVTFERHKTNRRVIHDLKKRSSIGLVFYILVSFLMVSADAFYTRHQALSLIFLSANLGVCFFRLLHLVVSAKTPDLYEALNNSIFFFSVVITALIWGMMLAMIMLLDEEHTSQMIALLCVSGLCAGGVVAFIPHRIIAILYNFAMLMPVIITMIVSGANLTIGILIFSFSIYMVLMVFRGNGEYWDALENEYLLEIKSREMTRLSNTDALTGLYNRRYFNDALDREWKRSGRENNLVSVILFDIDHFKKINDTFGHQAGDEYLRKTARMLISVFKRESDTVARFGGEEFTVLLPGTDAEHACRLALDAISKIETMILEYQGQKIRTTISAGITSSIPAFNTRSDSIVVDADKALYMAKQGGRNRGVIFPSPVTQE